MRKQKRTIRYAVTIVYKSYNETFIKGMTDKLLELYPLSSVLNQNTTNHITHVRLVNYLRPNPNLFLVPIDLTFFHDQSLLIFWEIRDSTEGKL